MAAAVEATDRSTNRPNNRRRQTLAKLLDVQRVPNNPQSAVETSLPHVAHDAVVLVPSVPIGERQGNNKDRRLSSVDRSHLI